MRLYTNVQVWGNKILYRGVENGRRVKGRLDYQPSLFVPCKEESPYKTIYGDNLAKMVFDDLREAKDFAKRHKDVSNMKVFGNQRYEYCFIADHFPDEIDWTIDMIRVANIDIEVGEKPGGGYAKHQDPQGEVTAITVKMDGRYHTFACGDYNNKRDDVNYYKCVNEANLLHRFLTFWENNYPDVITGWNILLFDIPYLVRRIRMILGEEDAKRLSPWGIIRDKKERISIDNEEDTFTLFGIATLDYITLYKKFAKNGKSQESYSLDNISHVELKERKLSYAEYGSLRTLYRENFQKFIDYNIRDTELVGRIDEKHKLIELALTLAYDNKCNIEDVFQQVRMWDVICFNHLKKQKKVVPPLVSHEKTEQFIGAFNKPPKIGFHNWVASFDVASMYPSIIMGLNISPETIIEPKDYTDDMRAILAEGVSIDGMLYGRVNFSDRLKKNNVGLTPNGQFYRRDKRGFMPEMVDKMFADRKRYKKIKINTEKEYEKETDPEKKAILKNKIAKYENLQQSKKVSLNSLYGASGSQYFRFFDIRNAAAVTTTGQLAIHWTENAINGYLNKILRTGDDDYVIAIDTDSLYLVLDELVRQTFGKAGKSTDDTRRVIRFLSKVCEFGLQPVIDQAYDQLSVANNAFEQRLSMKREVLADKAIWTAKKRYILRVWDNEGVEYAEPEMKIVGLDVIKSTTPMACKEKLREAINLMFTKDESAVQDLISNFRDEFEKLPIADVAIPKGVTGLTKYADPDTVYAKGTMLHIRGALIYNHLIRTKGLDKKYLPVQNGDKIKYVFLREPNTAKSDVLSFPMGGIPEELGLHQYIDWDLLYEAGFLNPLKLILNVIRWRSENKQTLGDYFG